MNREEIVKANTKLIWYLANKFYGIDKNDLYQAGVEAVLDAYKHYKAEKGAKFSTFAYISIWGAMSKLANQKTLKVSRDLIKLKKLIDKAQDYVTQSLGREATSKELAEFLGYSEEEIEAAIASCNSIISMDEEKDEARSLYETIPSVEGITSDDKILLADSMQTLNDFEKDIINLRYYQDLTQAETAQILGTSQVKVSRYEKRSLVKMRDFINM